MSQHTREICIFTLAQSSLKEVEHDTALLREHIVRTLLYYDIFNYPLKAEEVLRFLGTAETDLLFIRRELDSLVEEQRLYRFGEFYSVEDNPGHIARRVKGNEEAERHLPIAVKKAKLIARFPFVRAVLASGSLSKGYMDEKSDLDFFIITHPRRLWIARMLLVMYKRFFLFNSHKYFCVNYFIDTEHLEIEEKNLFTATELGTAIPLYGPHLYRALLENNAWLLSFFPNYRPRDTDNATPARSGWFKNLLEKTINLFGGDRLEHYFMQMTWQRWMMMYGKKYGASDFQVAFKTKNHVSKNHPRHYQKKVVTLYLEKVRAYSEKFNLSWKV